ncbi:MAG TPA: glycosyltransferase family 9 protein, partial [Gemmatimonadaceae bacterium]|nr:glycosyltransferase family 9 protein [Gemmatimonadaceae bacterium]
MRVQKILIVRLAGVGDVVMASTVVERIRATSPGATIHWLCGRTAAPLVERLHGVDVVLTLDEHRLLRGGFAAKIGELARVWRRLLGAGYTRVLLLHVDRRYRVLTVPIVLAGGKLSVLSRRDAHGAMNPVPGRSLSDEYARLVDGMEHRGPIAGHAPLATMRGSETIRRGTADGRRRVGLVPGGTKNVLRESVLKRWPPERYADVARALIADGREVLLVGDGADEWAKPFFNGIAVTDMIGRTTLPDTVSMLAGCDLVISHDT